MPDALSPSPFSEPKIREFCLDSAVEVHALLSDLRRLGASLTLTSSSGEYWAATLVEVDAALGVIELDSRIGSERMNSLLSSPEIDAQAFLDNIKLQFAVEGLMRVGRDGETLLRANLPTELYRFQRRQAYRVQPPGIDYPCASLGPPLALAGSFLRLRVLDVSVGGAALLLPAGRPIPPSGTEFADARLDLDRDTRIDVPLRIQHVSALPNGEGAHKMGCAFARLQPQTMRELQLFIDQTQKRRRLMNKG